MIGRRRIRRNRAGRFELRLPDSERELLRSLPRQIRPLLLERDPAATRIFPPAYSDQPEREAEYREMVGEELLQRHLASLETMEHTAESESLAEEEALAWLGALNDLRLVIGTRLDVSEEMEPLPREDPDAPTFALYSYLSWLEEQLVQALGDPR